MIITFAIITFALFAAYVETANFREWLRSIRSQVSRTYGKAEWVFPNAKQDQAWMRTNTIQNYK
jgi:hypothetical protein